MISSSIAQQIHNVVINNFGGSTGIRDLTALESALSRPFQPFENDELYPEIFQKAAALSESMIVNHPFIDGNKRTGYVLTRLLMISYHYDIVASEQEKYDFIISIASGNLPLEKIINWLKNHSQKTKSP